MTDFQLLAVAGIAVLVVLILLGIRRRRESILHRVRGLVLIEGAYLGLAFLLYHIGQPPLVCILGGMVAGFIVGSRIQPRSWYVPAAVKRRARARFELKTGMKFNPKKHEYDHDIPFSRGGSHTADNIRVVDRKRNRSKGSQTPWWDLLGMR